MEGKEGDRAIRNLKRLNCKHEPQIRIRKAKHTAARIICKNNV